MDLIKQQISGLRILRELTSIGNQVLWKYQRGL